MCEDLAELAIIHAEGSPMGPLLRAVNAVADAIASEFPHVVVDTLACKSSQVVQPAAPCEDTAKQSKATVCLMSNRGYLFALQTSTRARRRY